jgi:undecaprenyl diphosphate synthase
MAQAAKPQALPKHVAIIMDGNGRWATQKGFIRTRGHEEGSKRIDKIITLAAQLKIPYLSLFAFSTENWKRPQFEVTTLMKLLSRYLAENTEKLISNKIKLITQGQIHLLPKNLQEELKKVEKLSDTSNPALTLNICLSYGGRQEIIDGVKKVFSAIIDKKFLIEDLNENTFRDFLYQPTLPDPDLLIRTGGEMRISNFLLYQIAYTELYITDTYWPDFSGKEFLEATQFFSTRKRRFGDIQEITT